MRTFGEIKPKNQKFDARTAFSCLNIINFNCVIHQQIKKSSKKFGLKSFDSKQWKDRFRPVQWDALCGEFGGLFSVFLAWDIRSNEDLRCAFFETNAVVSQQSSSENILSILCWEAFADKHLVKNCWKVKAFFIKHTVFDILRVW